MTPDEDAAMREIRETDERLAALKLAPEAAERRRALAEVDRLARRAVELDWLVDAVEHEPRRSRGLALGLRAERRAVGEQLWTACSAAAAAGADCWLITDAIETAARSESAAQRAVHAEECGQQRGAGGGTRSAARAAPDERAGVAESGAASGPGERGADALASVVGSKSSDLPRRLRELYGALATARATGFVTDQHVGLALDYARALAEVQSLSTAARVAGADSERVAAAVRGDS